MLRGAMWQQGDRYPLYSCQLIVVTQGETRTLYGQVIDADGMPLDMEPDGELVWTTSTGLTKNTTALSIAWDDQARGLFHIDLSSAETAAISAAKGYHHHHDLWATTPGGESGLIWKGPLLALSTIGTPP
jgi:hypothetical protein